MDKDANGHEKNVQVDTPFGGIHVNTDQTTAGRSRAAGLSRRAGRRATTNDKSADMHMGFGEWELRVKAVNYETTDKKDKVIGVLQEGAGSLWRRHYLPGHTPPWARRLRPLKGLTCADDKDSHATVQIDRSDYGTSEDSLELKAGSKRHQHIVGFEDPENGQTRFALVALDLPGVVTDHPGKSN